MKKLSGDVLTPQGWIRGALQIEDGRIMDVSGHSVSEAEVLADERAKFIPGFIDLHVHGTMGVDLMSEDESLAYIARHQIRYGTTAFLATTMTDTLDKVRSVLGSIRHYLEQPKQDDHAEVLGVHLEGPYISENLLGAQPPQTREAVLDEILTLHAIAPLKVITLSPETMSDKTVITRLSELGIRVQIGHSSGTYEDGVEALEHGVSGFTHLFNGMTGLHHREPGIVGAALAHAQYAELIPDLLHVHPGAMRVALRSIPHLYCVTDATAATGMPDGDYMLGSQPVRKCLGGVRVANGSLAGSTLTMIEALRNLHSIGLSLADASSRLSAVPAAYLGLSDRGVLAAGAIADVVELAPDLSLRATYVRGVRHE